MNQPKKVVDANGVELQDKDFERLAVNILKVIKSGRLK